MTRLKDMCSEDACLVLVCVVKMRAWFWCSLYFQEFVRLHLSDRKTFR